MNIKVNDLRFQAALEADITSNLKYNFLGTARYATSTTQHKVNEHANAAEAYRAADNSIIRNQNTFLFDDPDNPNELPRVVMPYGGIMRTSDNKITTYTVRNSLEYTHTFKDVHNFKLYAGQEYRRTDRTLNSSDAYGIQFDKGNTPFIDPDLFQKFSNEGNDYYNFGETRDRGVTFFSNLTYDYDRKYILNLVGNYEGSNRAGRSSSARWLPTFNIAGRWNMHREKFIEDIPWISNLSLRASYGLVGIISNAASNNLAIFSNAITDRRDIIDRENVIHISELQNEDLTYERTLESNIGFDLGMFDNRIIINANAYLKKGRDLIDRIRTSGIGGQFTKLGNNANMTTKGIEFQLNTRNIVTDDFTWSTNLNISAFDQKITKLVQKPNVFDLVRETGGAVEGYSRATIWSFDFDKLNEDGIPTYNLGVDSDGNPKDGLRDIDFQDIEDITDYLKREGAVEPNVTGGISNRFQYKNFDFQFFITFSAGNVIRRTPRFKGAYSDVDVFSDDFLDRWLVPGDEEFTNVPTIASTQMRTTYGSTTIDRAYNAYNYSTERMAKGDYIRMRNISLGYSFPQGLINQWGFSQVKLTAQATNPFLIYSDRRLHGQDPEFVRSGGIAAPVPRQYTLTLNIGF